MQPLGSATRITILGATLLATAAGGAACSGGGGDSTGNTSSAITHSSDPNINHGQNIWLKATYGGENFFSILLPNVLGLNLGFGQVLTTPRSVRFTQWGVLNDPNCTDGNAETGGLDVCPDDTADDPPEDRQYEGQPSGIVGIRKYPNPYFNPGQAPSAANSPFIFGVSCAGCHAGLDAQNPPADPNHPTWGNIHLTTGNQYINIGKIFGANLPPTDPRWQVFHTWAPGTVDTTAIENDGINNPGIITQFYNFPERPTFSITSQDVNLANFDYSGGNGLTAHRAGQGGEDDAGCELATLRVYFNIGMCAAECMLPHLNNGPGGTQTPIDLNACAQVCPDLPAAEARAADECKFINDSASTPPPKLLSAAGGSGFVDLRAAAAGARVFAQNCASCHSNGQPPAGNDWTNDLPHPASGYNLLGEPPGDVGTNDCRALTTNWTEGHIWEQFSSDQYKARGPGYYRDVPLLGIWATAPFFHNNRLGKYTGDPSVAGRIAAFEDAYNQLVNPLLRNELGSIQTTTVAIQLPGVPVPLPAGTPVALFANLNQATGQLLCSDLVENGGHYFGALLSPADKNNLKEYLKTL